MTRIIILFSVFLMLASAAHGTVFTYDFATASSHPDGSSVGLTFSSMTSANVTAQNSSGTFRSSRWNSTGRLDSNEYVGFTITPDSGKKVSLTSISFQVARSSISAGRNVKDGPKSGVVQIFTGNSLVYSASFTPNDTSLAFVNLSTISGALPVNGTTETISVRFYGLNSGHNNGWMEFDNISVGTDVVPVPEPINVALGVFGSAFVAVGAGRKLLKKKA